MVASHQKASDPSSWTVQTTPWNSWQHTNNMVQWSPGSFGPVYACWKIISEEVSRIPLKQTSKAPDGSLTTVTNQAAARVMRTPNKYQTRSDFLLYLTQSLLAEGNGYARVVRNGRYEVAALYPVNPRMCTPHIDMVSGDVYYHTSDSYMTALSGIQDMGWIPARDMLHVRLFTPNHPLMGETPLVAAAMSVQAGSAINGQVASFFNNMARPSGILKHPKTLSPEGITRIKERFMDASRREKAGEPVVLTEGMEWAPLTMSAVDAELIASAKLTQSQIAEIYRVPPFMLGNLEQAKFATVEALTRWFINSGLGFYLDHISDSLTRLFELPPTDEIVFDYEAAMFRADFGAFMTALKEGVQGAVISPDEARAMRGLPPAVGGYGKEPRAQQQLVPLSWGGFEFTPPKPAVVPAPEPVPAPDPATKDVRVELMRRKMLGEAA
jgi:HK97 family phage portal protein